MPSDSKKKKEQQKKEARKKKDIKKPANSANDQAEEDEQDDQDQQNEEETTTLTAKNGTNGATTAKPARNPFDMTEIKKHLDEVLEVEKMNAENRACTGVLASHPNGRDTHIHQFSLTFYGQELVVSPLI